MRKYIFLFIGLIAGVFIGNQVFNHINAWLGIAIITITIILVINRLIKFIKNENKN